MGYPGLTLTVCGNFGRFELTIAFLDTVDILRTKENGHSNATWMLQLFYNIFFIPQC